ncbi:aldehyde dehydrogenase family protein, partial [Pseudomonas oryzihabitans]
MPLHLDLQDPRLFKESAYVDGHWITADNGATFAVEDPATGETIAQVAALEAAETARAIAAAEAAWPAWR